jgi:hypothetical protein
MCKKFNRRLTQTIKIFYLGDPTSPEGYDGTGLSRQKSRVCPRLSSEQSEPRGAGCKLGRLIKHSGTDNVIIGISNQFYQLNQRRTKYKKQRLSDYTAFHNNVPKYRSAA